MKDDAAKSQEDDVHEDRDQPSLESRPENPDVRKIGGITFVSGSDSDETGYVA